MIIVPELDPSLDNPEFKSLDPAPNEVVLYLKAIFIKPSSLKERGLRPIMNEPKGYLIVGDKNEVIDFLKESLEDTISRYKKDT